MHAVVNQMNWARALSRKEAAEVWGVSYRLVIKLDKLGLIKTIRIGRCKRVPPDEVARVLREGI
jgi:hypothetical protein